MSSGSSRSYIAGVDIGGTKILSLVTDLAGREVGRDRRSTEAHKGPDAVIDRIEASLRMALSNAKVEVKALAGIGLATAGACDTERGVVTESPNLPGWRDVPLAPIMAERLGVAAYLENDATAAALGEHRFGAGQGTRHMIYITVSTGVGGGIIIAGRPYRGASGAAGEVGHMTIDIDGPACRCGSNGHLESLIGGWAMAARARQAAASGRRTRLADEAEITAESIQRAALAGDAVASELIAEQARHLGIGLANLVNIFNPELILVGGGQSAMGDLLLGPARRVVQERALALPARAARIELASLGDLAGALGAVAAVQDRQQL